MKLRDYLFLAALTLLLCWAFRAPAAPPPPEVPATATQRFLVKASWWLALARLAAGPPQAPPPGESLRQELPDAVVNAPPIRTIGPDGQPLLDHSAGW